MGVSPAKQVYRRCSAVSVGSPLGAWSVAGCRLGRVWPLRMSRSCLPLNTNYALRVPKCSRRPRMQQGHMLIDRRCRLRAAVAIGAVEIEGGDATLAVSTFECGAAIHRFGCVISHIISYLQSVLPVWACGAIGAQS